MKYILFICSLILSTFSNAEQVPTSEALLNQQYVAGINEFQKKVYYSEVLPASSAGCPAAGFKIINGAERQTGGLVKAEKYLSIVGTSAQTQAQALTKTNMCGSCQQTVNVTPFVITQPAKVKYKPECDARPTVSFESDFQTDKEAEDYSQAILKNKNQEGQRLYAGCQDPCAFTVYAGKRTLPNGKIRSTMTVNCGQPRSSSILFANYNYSYGTAVQWSCIK